MIHLPPLPVPSSVSVTSADTGSVELRDNYTAEQMRAYVEADRVQLDIESIYLNSERFKWLELQDLMYVELRYVVDTKYDGKYSVDTADGTYYGDTLGLAFDSAMKGKTK